MKRPCAGSWLVRGRTKPTGRRASLEEASFALVRPSLWPGDGPRSLETQVRGLAHASSRLDRASPTLDRGRSRLVAPSTKRKDASSKLVRRSPKLVRAPFRFEVRPSCLEDGLPLPGGVLEEERPPAPLEVPCLPMAPQWSRASEASRGGTRLRVPEYPRKSPQSAVQLNGAWSCRPHRLKCEPRRQVCGMHCTPDAHSAAVTHTCAAPIVAEISVG
jgi:hypothetical protein